MAKTLSDDLQASSRGQSFRAKPRSAPYSIGTIPSARCGPTPPTARRRTWPYSTAAASNRNSSARSRAASRCRRTSAAAMPTGLGCVPGSNMSLPPRNAGWASSCAPLAWCVPGSKSASPILPTTSRDWPGFRVDPRPREAACRPQAGPTKHRLLENASAPPPPARKPPRRPNLGANVLIERNRSAVGSG